MWVSFSDDDVSRYRELADVLFACRNAYRDMVESTQWHPAPGSLAERDHVRLLDHDPPHPSHVMTAIPKVLHSYASAASEHLEGMGTLYAAGQVMLSPAVLARSALECCAHLAWVLQGIESTGRLARAYLALVASAEEAKKNSGRVLGKTHPEYVREASAFKALKKQAKQLFPAPWSDGDGRPEYCGETMPGLEDSVAARYTSAESGRGIYGRLSNFVHPTVYTIAQIAGVVRDGDELKPKLQMTTQHHTDRVQIVVVAFYTTFGATIQYYGWSGEAFDVMTRQIDRVLPGALKPAEPS